MGMCVAKKMRYAQSRLRVGKEKGVVITMVEYEKLSDHERGREGDAT